MRNYDYLPDDSDALKSEIAELDAKIRELEDVPGVPEMTDELRTAAEYVRDNNGSENDSPCIHDLDDKFVEHAKKLSQFYRDLHGLD